MPSNPERSVFATLQEVFDESRLRCDSCGYLDEDGAWTVETRGSSITYRHVCPGCGVTNVLTVDPDG